MFGQAKCAANSSGKQRAMPVRTLGLGQQQLEVAVGAHRVTKKQTLNIGALQGLQKIQLLFGFNALCDHVHIQAPTHMYDRSDYGRIVRIDSNVFHKGLVNLQRIDRKLLKSAQ